MRALLEILSGHQSFRRIRLEAGRPLRVGRCAPAELMLHQDTHIAALHFSIEFDGTSCQLSVLPEGGSVQLEGAPTAMAELKDGSTWVAGQTWFALGLRSPGATASLSRSLSGLLELLRSTSAPLFALLDAARDQSVLNLLRASNEEFQSLYEGLRGQVLFTQAPYLLRLTPDSNFLPRLLTQGWGKAWGVFLTSYRPFDELRRHLRRFLFVQDGLGREVYLRFYDPRVLQVLLPACSNEQTMALLSGVDSFLLEGASPLELLCFMRDDQELISRRVELQRAD